MPNKMRKLKISDYSVPVRLESGETKEVKFVFKAQLEDMLTSPILKLKPVDLLSHADLARKISNCKDEYILLDAKEYEMIKNALDKFEGLPKFYEEMIRRIYYAEEVEVEEKKL